MGANVGRLSRRFRGPCKVWTPEDGAGHGQQRARRPSDGAAATPLTSRPPELELHPSRPTPARPRFPVMIRQQALPVPDVVRNGNVYWMPAPRRTER